MLPDGLDATLSEVAKRRCASCHQDVKNVASLPHSFYVRIDHPERNAFLRAPLAKSAGGTGACGQEVFASTRDLDYQKIIRLFVPLQRALTKRPRMDMVPIDQQTPMEQCQP